MAFFKSTYEAVHKLRKWYIAALSILLFMLLLSHLIIQYTIQSKESDSRVVNIAGRQRMLSQRISKAAFGLYYRADNKDYDRYLNELDAAVELWKRSHTGLQVGDEELGLPGENSSEIMSMYRQIEPVYTEFVEAADEVRRLASNPSYNNKDLLPAITVIKNNESDYLKGMDAIVFQYDYESKKKIGQIRVVEMVILVLTLIILGLEVLFIFRPAMLFVRGAMEEFKSFLDVNIDILCVSDIEGNFYKVNKKFEEILGYRADEVEGKNFVLFVHEEDIPATLEAIKEFKKKNVLIHFTNRYRCKDGSYKHIDWYSQSGSGKYVYSSARDVTDKKISEEKLKNMAVKDELTGLYNRHYFDIVISEEMERADRNKETLSMLLLDLDHFKKVNDTWGHPVGDELLRLTAETMGNNKRKSDILFRFGGEEFILLMPHTSIEGAAVVAENLRAAIEKNNHPVTGVQTVSIGAAERIKSEAFSSWYKRTDDALYKAKQSGRNRVVLAGVTADDLVSKMAK
jgi:diguanylate cyclase (GGDEF)-like protein/PAS domain S-box-containing protein